MAIVIYALAYLSAVVFSAGGGRFYQPSGQYLSPTKTDRPIYTVTADVMFGRNVTRRGWLVVGSGMGLVRYF